MADKNLRALAKQSWDSIFAEAYPKLAGMIRSINEEMERTLQDSSREIKTSTVAIESFDEKLVTTKANISSLVRSQEKMSDYLSSISDIIDKKDDTDTPAVDLSNLSKNATKGGAVRTAAGALAGRSPAGFGIKALLAVTGIAGVAGAANALKDSSESNSGGSLSSLSASDSIKFVADKIIFKSAKGSQGSPEASGGSTGGGGGSSGSSTPPDAQRAQPSSDSGQGGGQSSRGTGGGAQSSGSTGGGGQLQDGSDQSKNTIPDESSGATVADSGEGSKEKPKNVSVEGADASKVDQGLLTSFYRAAADYGRPVSISSGFRSDEKQAELYARWQAGEPNIFMPARPVKGRTVTVRGRSFNVPGGGRGSNHSTGAAIDSPQAEAMDKAGILKKYGLTRPYGAKDPVHIQKSGGSEPAETPEPAGEQVAGTPTTGAKVNKASVEKKVETEKMQQQPSSTQINSLISQSPSSQTPDQQPEKPRGREVSTRDRLGQLVASYQPIS